MTIFLDRLNIGIGCIINLYNRYRYTGKRSLSRIFLPWLVRIDAVKRGKIWYITRQAMALYLESVNRLEFER